MMTAEIQLQRSGDEGMGCRIAGRTRRIMPTTPPRRTSCRRPDRPLAARWPNRDPIGEEAFFIHYVEGKSIEEIIALSQQALWPPYVFVGNSPTDAIDKYGLACPPNTCDYWKLTLLTVTSAGYKGAALGANAQMDASRERCCMDNYASKYQFLGGGLGIGLKYTFTVSSSGVWFTTDCIPWKAHNGFGRITTAGIGIWWTFGTVWAHTPQTYQNFTGWGRGIDASIVTSVGYWNLQPGLSSP